MGILREQEGGMVTADACRRHGIRSTPVVELEAEE